MSYLSSKKIYPGNWTNALNGWYKNIDADYGGSNDASKAGPTSVLAVPGYRYFQQRGYVAVTWTSGDAATKGQTMDVIVPSPYRQDDTRPDITGMVISGNATQPAFVYRAAISVASGWGDNRVSSGIYASTGNVITFGRNDSGPVAVTGVGEPIAQANLTSTVSGDAATKIFFAAGSQALSSTPFLTATGATGLGPSGVYKSLTGATTFKVFARGTNTDTGVSGGIYISSADSTAGLKGYLVVEVCYIQPDDAPGYDDIEDYLLARTVSD
jgi:hypothetical protein